MYTLRRQHAPLCVRSVGNARTVMYKFARLAACQYRRTVSSVEEMQRSLSVQVFSSFFQNRLGIM